jgi:hypothetical protein
MLTSSYLDLIVAAALDAVKETVELPWKKSSPASPEAQEATPDAVAVPVPASDKTTASAIVDAASVTGPSSESLNIDPSPEAKASTTQHAEADASQGDKTGEIQEGKADKTPAENLPPAAPARVLRWRNFAHALTEIWPSASEHLGTHAKLKAWNDKFGGGARRKAKDSDDIGEGHVSRDHDTALSKVKRAFDLTEEERGLLDCVVDPGALYAHTSSPYALTTSCCSGHHHDLRRCASSAGDNRCRANNCLTPARTPGGLHPRHSQGAWCAR